MVGATLVATAPGSLGTATNTVTGCSWGTLAHPASMSGDAVATITNTSDSNYDLRLTLTNFTLNSTNVTPM
jgi:hypothetical protein